MQYNAKFDIFLIIKKYGFYFYILFIILMK